MAEQSSAADDRADRRDDAARAPRSLAGDRTDYVAGTLDDDSVADVDPIDLFGRWMDDAFARREQHGDLPDPTAVVLSTLEIGDGPDEPAVRPRSRTVLLKEADAEGFVVYTNYRSAKGREAQRTPWGAMLLPWYALERQVRIEGRIERVPDAQSDAYFASRPRGSQIGAWASQQSEEAASREELDAAYAETEARFAGRDVPRPPHWGGLRLVPDRIEFWQGRHGRMHDRIVFRRGPGGTSGEAAHGPREAEPWTHARLQP